MSDLTQYSNLAPLQRYSFNYMIIIDDNAAQYKANYNYDRNNKHIVELTPPHDKNRPFYTLS